MFDEYRRYLDSIRDLLPQDLRLLAVDISLHDARLRRLHFAEGTLELFLDGCGYEAEPVPTYFDRKLRLTYRGVRAITETADPEAGLPGPHGYGDLGYHEVEIIDAGIYEHRMLFSSGIELHVQFTEFALWYDDDCNH